MIDNIICQYGEEYYNYFKQCESQFFIELYKKHNNIELITKINNNICEQQILRTIINNELKKLFDFAAKNNISVVGFKGIFIESDLYSDIKYTRIYDDVDLLVKNDEREVLSNFFKNENYVIYDDKQSIISKVLKGYFENPLRMNKINIDKTNHIVMGKIIEDKNLVIELHSNFNALKLSEFNHEELIRNRKALKMNATNFYSLNNIDHLLFVCHHLIRHLPYVYQDSIEPLYISFDKIVDIYLMTQKYDLDKEMILEKSLHYNVVPYLTLALYIVNGIFQNSIESELISELINKSLSSMFSWKNIFVKLINMPAIDIISGNLEDELPELVNAVNFIEKNIGPFREYSAWRNIKLLIWKKALHKVK